LLVRGTVIAITGFPPRRVQQSFVLEIAKHPNADAGAARELSDLHDDSLDPHSAVRL
jgi:hypothetical protein